MKEKRVGRSIKWLANKLEEKINREIDRFVAVAKKSKVRQTPYSMNLYYRRLYSIAEQFVPVMYILEIQKPKFAEAVKAILNTKKDS